MILVCESEWGTGGGASYFDKVRFDFEKLMVAREGLRLMIFDARDAKVAERFCGLLAEFATKSRLSRPGDRYLFAAVVAEEDNKFRFWRYTRGKRAKLVAFEP